jgi:parallel beta-helix repeat protein
MMTRYFQILFFIICVSSLMSCCVAGGTRVVDSDFSGNVSWSGRVAVHGDVTIAAGSVLTIEPGTEVVFQPAGQNDRYVDHPNFPGSELIVRGKVVAIGTAEEPITFRYVDETAPAGSWGGVNIVESFDSTFEYVRFRQADSAIHSQESRVYIEKSIFEENLVGIRFHSSEILIENNLIRNNGSGIRFHFGQPVICKNDIVDNRKGIFITSYPRNYLVENNTIRNNERNVVLGEEVPEDVVLRRNFWGTEDPEVIRSRFFDGQMESYLGNILFEPFRSAPDPDSGVNWK